MSTSIRPRNGHARDHLREAMCDAIHDLCHQPLGHPEPKVELDGRQLTMTQLCGLLWACTDQLPGYEVEL